jgi:hypothetical protein
LIEPHVPPQEELAEIGHAKFVEESSLKAGAL